METTMERTSTFRPLGFGGAVAEQLRVLWQSRRPLLMIIALLAVLTLSGEPWSDNPMARLFSLWPLYLGPAPLLWAFAVWHNEGPTNRLYFWTQPVGRGAHALARVVAGAVWLIVMQAILILAGALFASVDGDLAQFGMVGAAAWLSFFTAPLLVYTILSVLTLPSDYPIRWFLGLLFGVPFILSLMDEWLELEGAVRFLLKPLAAEWGIGATLLGPMMVAVDRLDDLLADMPYDGTAPFDISTWWIAMPLWLIFSAALVVFLAGRHPDRYPTPARLRSYT